MKRCMRKIGWPTDKLKEGIEGFSEALVKLEGLLKKRLAELEAREPAATRS